MPTAYSYRMIATVTDVLRTLWCSEQLLVSDQHLLEKYREEEDRPRFIESTSYKP
jgi:hypothetical protein